MSTAEEELRRRQQALEAEPADSAGVTTIKVMLLDGSSVRRRFDLDGPISAVFDFLATLPQLVGVNWQLHGQLACEGHLYATEESLRELGITGPTLLRLVDSDA